MNKAKSPLTYRDAGVDIAKADDLVTDIKAIAAKSRRPEVLAGIGGFGALFDLSLGQYRQPVLVSGTDGVGTKLKLAMSMQRHDTIGIDLVAMCVNDIICQGAEPLFFLDYFATGQLNVEQAKHVVAGIGRGCEMAGAALIGGETAEMPGMYHGDDYDLAGFCVGVVEKDEIIDGSNIKSGDQLIALASSGPHSNGYSLIRKVLQQHEINLQQDFGDTTIGEVLLTPTKIYAKNVLRLREQFELKAIVHITGGGCVENIPRVLPKNVSVQLWRRDWEWPDIFSWLQTRGNISEDEMLLTFNLGIGLVICVAADDVDACVEALNRSGETAWHVGEVVDASDDAARVTLVD